MAALLTIALLGMLVLSVPVPVGAQIYEWRDGTGSRHFTNDLEDIPEAMREQARVVVRASPKAAADETVTGDAGDAVANADPEPRPDRRRARPEPPRQAQVIYDNSFRFARRQPQYEPPPPQPAPEVHVNISGPLAVSQVIVPESQPAVVGGYYGGTIPLGLRPNAPRSRHPRPMPASPGSVLSPAPLAPGSPAFMPAMGSSLGRSRIQQR